MHGQPHIRFTLHWLTETKGSQKAIKQEAEIRHHPQQPRDFVQWTQYGNKREQIKMTFNTEMTASCIQKMPDITQSKNILHLRFFVSE